ncbi:hypothetical protein GKD08_14820 [Paeniclostridium sordellii]|uniref:hypothetical protein n=1 Tax=Paraclostridium sordellii TaxID=1505 RepID=UPI0012B0692B|nr:hypothetical protein [Paeniclostridium sordellii]MDU4414957.1 hypothetical protein [Paeniclostridium sordellii]MRZ30029.1 hypothetical protein [Paeniclostridium sordellii]
MSKSQVIETKYCKILKQAKIRENSEVYSIEKIFINGLNQEEIRLAYYKDIVRLGKLQKEAFIPRPVDLSEDKLIELISQAVNKKVFSKEFVDKLREIIS